MQCVAFVGGSSDAAGAAILLKVVRYFSDAPRAIQRLCAILELSGTTKTVCSVIEYYVCQYCARNNVLVNGYPVFAQYKVMISFYSKRHFSARWEDDAPPRGNSGTMLRLPLRGAHFLYWFIVHDLDQEFVANFELFKTSMSMHRRQMARTYRRRQQAKQLQPSSPSTPPPLGRTAARTDRLRPPVMTKRRRRSYAATAQRDADSPPSWLAAAAVAAAAAAAAMATTGGAPSTSSSSAATTSDSGDDDGGGGILGGGGVAAQV